MKIATRDHFGPSSDDLRPPISRPPRRPSLNGSAVGIVLESVGATVKTLNDYLAVLHVSAGLFLLAFCVGDIMGGGPSRHGAIPILGAYMSASVVFHTVLRLRRPVLLLWINSLSDVVLLVVAHRLIFFSLGTLGADVTMGLLTALLVIVYGSAGQERLTLSLSALAAVFYCYSLLSPATGIPVVDERAVATLAIMAAATVVGYRIARTVQSRDLSMAIRTLERLESAVAIHRLRNLGPWRRGD